VARDQHFTDSQLGKSEVGVVRTREVRVHERITVIDRRRDLDRRSGPKELTSSGIGRREEAIVELRETQVSIHEGDQDRWITGIVDR
jgi:hypothetical protein